MQKKNFFYHTRSPSAQNRNDISYKWNEIHQKSRTSRQISCAFRCAFTFRNNFLFTFLSYSETIYALQRFAEMNLETQHAIQYLVIITRDTLTYVLSHTLQWWLAQVIRIVRINTSRLKARSLFRTFISFIQEDFARRDVTFMTCIKLKCGRLWNCYGTT